MYFKYHFLTFMCSKYHSLSFMFALVQSCLISVVLRKCQNEEDISFITIKYCSIPLIILIIFYMKGFFDGMGWDWTVMRFLKKFCPVLLNGMGMAPKSISLMLAAAVRDWVFMGQKKSWPCSKLHFGMPRKT